MDVNADNSPFGQSKLTLKLTFDAFVSFLLTHEKSFGLIEMSQAISATTSSPGFFTSVSEERVFRHTCLIYRLINIESQAFLTDIQLEERIQLCKQRTESWESMLDDLDIVLRPQIRTEQSTLRQLDALFLTQLEWMHDVKFETCSPECRLNILRESPFFDVFSLFDI